jgi:hypothetical protein
MNKIYRGADNSSNDKKENTKIDKDSLSYRGSKSIIEGSNVDIKKSDLIYRGVSENTTYYSLAKIRSVQKRRKLYHSGLELYGARQYA